MNLPKQDNDQEVDICLLLEGTYPYVSGGVSHWLDQIINGLSEYTFAIIFIGGDPEAYGGLQYTLPENLKHVECHYLMESWDRNKPHIRQGNFGPLKQAFELVEKLKTAKKGELRQPLEDLIPLLGHEDGITLDDFLYSKHVWDLTIQHYQRYCTDPSFIDYFWTVRTMLAPAFKLADVAKTAPKAKAYHSISTGYAGFLGLLLHYRRKQPYILTEHGIYTKERKIDLAHMSWIADAQETFHGSLDEDVSYIRRMWISFFESIGRMVYDSADPIISLYEGNQQRQIQDGANEASTYVVPNGINIERFSRLRQQRPDMPPPVIALLGRVVPIKDIKTFIRAMRVVCGEMPQMEAWIVGETQQENEEYADECRELVNTFSLQQKIRFLGFQDIEKILPQIGLIVLTSISEALPLVILEGFAAGIPAVTTDVGACRELIEGSSPEDQALGRAGRVVPIHNPTATAKAIIELLASPSEWNSAQQAGIARVEQHYTQTKMFNSYRHIYNAAIGEERWQG